MIRFNARYRYGTGTKVAFTGIDWVFAPTLAIVQDALWGTYEGV